MIPVVFHNLKGYESHVILKHITRIYAPNEISVTVMNMEKYLSFELDGLRFLDPSSFSTVA